MRELELKRLIQIPSEESLKFGKLVKDYRAKYIKSPKDMVDLVFERYATLLVDLKTNGKISEAIHILREETYKEFLAEETVFNTKVLEELTLQFETPKAIVDLIIAENIQEQKGEELIAAIERICGEYAGCISPYLYALCLSNTQSRRSRAGSTFESIIYKLYETFEYPFVSQGQIGKATFEANGLGKLVDSLLPNLEAFGKRRDKVIIGTMKTTLRERWQEVIEEIVRTGVPRIYLLTMDDKISKSKATQMAKHNVIVVVHKDVKKIEALATMHNIVSFEDYFLQEIPEILRYWTKQ